MAPKGASKQQSEEDLLLQDFSRNLSAKSSALFFGNAFIVSAIPICELWERAGWGRPPAGPARWAGTWQGPADWRESAAGTRLALSPDRPELGEAGRPCRPQCSRLRWRWAASPESHWWSFLEGRWFPGLSCGDCGSPVLGWQPRLCI